MRKSETDAVNSYLKRSSVGGVLGIAVGIAGARLAVLQHGGTLAEQPLLSLASFGAAVGVLSGLAFEWLGQLRTHGRIGYLASWALAVGAGSAAVVTPSAVAEKSWMDFIFVTVLGVASGLGLGLFAEEFRDKN